MFAVEVKPQIDMDGAKRREPTNSRPRPESQRGDIAKLIKSLPDIEEQSSLQANLTGQREDPIHTENHQFF